uniref:Uncharacterized protein n=1 Tax=Aegilops tauschii subsp. strangulata TaxID=200361 RepID=A0A453DU81_AEGTS
MAPIKDNTQAICFVVLLMMSSTLWSCQATTRNKGTTGLWTSCTPFRACQIPTPNNVAMCKLSCEWRGYNFEKSHCDRSIWCCCEW